MSVIIIPPPQYETEHFDDFATADLALRGAKRVAEEKRREAEQQKWQEGGISEEEFEENKSLERAEDYDERYDENEDYDEDGYDDEYDEYDEYDYEEDEPYYGELREEEQERESKFELMTIPKEILEEYDLPQDLPDGVAIMGGTARSIARRMVTGDKEPVRDLDLVFIPELADVDNPPDKEALDRLSAKYMPDDYAYGHGIGTDNLENYFGGRDFTVNQCLVAGDKLLMTRAAYDDFQENIIRPSFHRQSYENEPTNTRQLARALLLQSVVAGFSSSYPTLEDFCTKKIDREIKECQGKDVRLDSFQLAVAMNKALSRGAETANRFANILADWDIVASDYVDEPLHLARELRDNCYSFDFRPGEEEPEEEPLDHRSLDQEISGLSKFRTSDPAVREALREYESHDLADPYRDIRERKGGAYSQGDYDWVNRTGEFLTPKRYEDDDDWY